MHKKQKKLGLEEILFPERMVDKERMCGWLDCPS